MPVYEEKEKVNGQKRYYIRLYVNDEYGKVKQIERHNKNWVGREGKKEAEWEENKLKNIYFKNSDLTKIQFYRTSLKNIDLSDANISGISVPLEDIKGAIINEFQAIDLLYLLGVKLK